MNHIPVMLPEVVRLMAPHAGGVYLDGTFGGGGYTAALLEAAPCTVWAIDRDPEAIARGATLAARYSGRLHLIQGQFGAMLALLAESGVIALDGVVLDLGV
jgi:16S rRNA (cytosine1402-N4)-methyltransferase